MPKHPSLVTLAHAIETHVKPHDAAQIIAAATAPHKTPEQIADDVIDALDALIPWAAIVPGWGVLIDEADGPALKAVVHALLAHRAKGGGE